MNHGLVLQQFGGSAPGVSTLWKGRAGAPQWGTLIADGRDYLADAWWVSTLAGPTVAALVLAVNRISRALDGEWAAGE